jgi:hypothetical protein
VLQSICTTNSLYYDVEQQNPSLTLARSFRDDLRRYL